MRSIVKSLRLCSNLFRSKRVQSMTLAYLTRMDTPLSEPLVFKVGGASAGGLAAGVVVAVGVLA